MPDLGAPLAFEMIRRAPSQRTAGLITGMTGYRETALGRFSQREAAHLIVPLIISLGSPFLIALGRKPDAADRQPSFAAGLYAGPVHIESDGGAECVQVDFTPLGAYRFFGGGVVDLVARMVDMSDVLGREGRQLRERLGATACWQRRFDLLEDFIAGRANHLPSPEIAFAWRRLARTAGSARITALAGEIGWSRKHLVERFRSELGLAPKSIARMMRFDRACRLARSGTAPGWAGIAAESGFADQAHLVREFGELAGETPTAWAQRLALIDSRLTRPNEAFSDW
ncbi:AraC family transcriptional regulator [Bradyrhizobium sp. AUGA SZCCT0169]|uniref:helix-turn-helix domain-containing protein n=1 Tax=Bradyrhizobium sp. AUGA SZCCT0169 TaxID=2807663 RepID=UPI001BACA732|nr:helix-turn-helix domain-containing protein [Bradyrhizobium sp. AUGA SZCCT0169]MBR1248972.1 AraC family transcriptional regulator [Bradyrhizobium sp. AUGA SZCCT0169]